MPPKQTPKGPFAVLVIGGRLALLEFAFRPAVSEISYDNEAVSVVLLKSLDEFVQLQDNKWQKEQRVSSGVNVFVRSRSESLWYPSPSS